MNNLIKSNEINELKGNLLTFLDDLLKHDGFGDIRIEVRILKRQQKEVILHYGKQYRYVVDYPENMMNNPL